jgi:hypothetical protein
MSMTMSTSPSTNPIDTAALLDDLKRLVKGLKADLLERAEEVTEVGAGLRAAHRAVVEGERTAQAFEAWRDDYLEQVAVAWILACVFVRYLEDNDLIEETYLAGVGDRRRAAEDALDAFHRAHPHDTDRDYLLDVFRRVGSFQAVADLYAEGKTPIWAVGPSGDGAKRLLRFWQEIDPASGGLKRSFRTEEGDTRFLGDLYQDLSEAARKKYALLQTPEFVEEFILDHTLTPALDEFGLEKVRLIDPTCGSGHFLLGAFRRLFDLWARREPGTERAVLAGRVLEDQVFGVDVNPFAVAIARFRLIVEAMPACGIGRLKEAPGWHVNVVFGDSLMHGDKFDRRGFSQEWLPSGEPWADPIYSIEDPAGLKRVLGRQYHVVVGNPPYITVKDAKVSERYRRRWDTCHKKYSMGVPFTERFFNLSLAQDGTQPSGYIGMITANSFMKREFGKKLIEEFLPEYDLTNVIDTSGAYIPGHSTPTVILFGRNRRPVNDEVRAVLGIRGGPSTPEDPAGGLVWRWIVDHIGNGIAQNEFVSVTNLPRATFGKHPWSIGGGGAAELKEKLEEAADCSLGESVEVIGVFGMTNADEVFLADRASFLRRHVEPIATKQLLVGDEIRDWTSVEGDYSIFPYDSRGQLIDIVDVAGLHHWLWPCRTTLGNRATFSKGTYFSEGLPWWKWHQVTLDRLRTPLSITLSFIASHNHFVLDRGGKVFNRSAPVIKLRADATEDDHLALLGLLNSSTTCFWLKQITQIKTQTTGMDSETWQLRREFDSAKIEKYPIVFTCDRVLDIARELDTLARRCAELSPTSLIKTEVPTASRLSSNRDETERHQAHMVSLQEELDWLIYHHYSLTEPAVGVDSKGEPYHNPPEVGLGERPFEIAMARAVAIGEDQAGWFERHGATPTTEIPEHWPEAYRSLVASRIETIAENSNIALIERPEYKRRWLREPWDDQVKRALRSWLLDRLESGRYWPDPAQAPPELVSCAALANIAAQDADFQQVAALYAGRPDFDLARLVEDLVASESVPFLPVLRYKPSGLTKRQVWERTWDLQRREDAGEDVQRSRCRRNTPRPTS